MRLTMGPYTDSDMLPANDAVALLTKFAAERATPQTAPQEICTMSQYEVTSVAKGLALLDVGPETLSLSNAPSVTNSRNAAEDAPCRNRTCNPLIKSQLLCQLS